MSTSTTTYQISGMTCGHCVSSVTQAFQGLPGVTDVAVDLGSGQATVTSDAPLDAGVVKETIEEAGFELVS